MLKKILIGLVVVVVAVLGLAMTQPDSFQVQRTITINAPPEKVIGYLNDFHAWQAWSPWEKLDPNMQRNFEGPASGVGSAYGWSGNDDVGQGRMEITENVVPNKVGIKLGFIKPFEAHNTTVFTLVPQTHGTLVTWTMSGPSPFITKLMGLFVSMDKMIGKDFEKGLAQLKEVAEK
ncbi:SRPBCC family protein [Massilia endophytica]|uniref:SRPBCC family protein n=1 Tax=Massilia endophytica TaxID=2899220 RepID=UPI001E5D5042|nr:SRPBCC family protein [Massilia endophytica]UGQ44688.1 SRPBCC family protein [Massilia endophytica]